MTVLLSHELPYSLLAYQTLVVGEFDGSLQDSLHFVADGGLFEGSEGKDNSGVGNVAVDFSHPDVGEL